MMKPRDSYLEKIKYKLIRMSFSIISQMHCREEIYAILTFYECLQFIFCILKLFINEYSNLPFQVINYCFNILFLSNIIVNSLIPIIVLPILITIMIILAITLIVMTDKIKSSAFLKSVKIISLIYIFFFKIGVLPLYILCSKVISCKNLNLEVCNNDGYKGIIILGIFSYISTFLCTSYFSLFLIDNRLNSPNSRAQPFSNIQFYSSLNPLVFSLMFNLDVSWIFIFILIILIALICLILVLRVRNYYFIYSKIANFCEINKDLLILLFLILLFIRSLDIAQISIAVNIYIIIILLFLGLLFNLYCLSINEDLNSLFPHQQGNEFVLQAYFRAYFNRIIKLEKNCTDYEISREISKIFIYGNLLREEHDILLKCYLLLKNHVQGDKVLKFDESNALKEFLVIQLNRSVKDNPKFCNLRILQSFFQLFFFQKFAKSFYDLEKAYETSNSIQTSISFLLHIKIIEHELQ